MKITKDELLKIINTIISKYRDSSKLQTKVTFTKDGNCVGIIMKDTSTTISVNKYFEKTYKYSNWFNAFFDIKNYTSILKCEIRYNITSIEEPKNDTIAFQIPRLDYEHIFATITSIISETKRIKSENSFSNLITYINNDD